MPEPLSSRVTRLGVTLTEIEMLLLTATRFAYNSAAAPATTWPLVTASA